MDHDDEIERISLGNRPSLTAFDSKHSSGLGHGQRRHPTTSTLTANVSECPRTRRREGLNLPPRKIYFVTIGGGALAAALGENDNITHAFHPDGRS